MRQNAACFAYAQDYGFVYGRPAIAESLVDEEAGRLLRDFMVRVGVRQSPVLAALRAAIAAEERQLTATRRAFWVPSLTIGAGVNYLAAQSSSSTGTSSSNDTEWGVKAGVSFPLVAGGAKFSELEQSRLTVSSLRTQSHSEQQTIEESIRTAFAEASGSYASLGFARAGVVSSQKNFELVDESYTAGASSIIDLIDAQSQLIEAQMRALNAYYGFLGDLMAAEEAINFFTFLEPDSEVSSLLDQLEMELRRDR